jgi:hypothetical protein
VKPRLILLVALMLAACAEDKGSERASTGAGQATQPRQTTRDEPASPAPPPDAGTQAGHGADPGRVTVPERDSSPPTATITLARAEGTALAETSQPEHGSRPDIVTLDEPALRGTTTGRDADGGVARVRVSIREEIECRAAGGDYERLRTRYFPPPQVERIRSNPGARLPTRAMRSLPIRLSESRCHPGRLAAVHGELWGEAINGSGLEAVTPHLRFVYETD